MKMAKPSTSRPRMEPYISVTRRRSVGVRAANDCRIIRPSRNWRDVSESDTVGTLTYLHITCKYLSPAQRPVAGGLVWWELVPEQETTMTTYQAAEAVHHADGSPVQGPVTVGAGPLTPAEVVAVARAGATGRPGAEARASTRRGRT